MTSIAIKRTYYQFEDRSWLQVQPGGSEFGRTISGTLDISAFTAGTHYPNGYIPSGIVLGKITSSGLYGPYAGRSNEVQLITPATSGDTTVVFDGASAGALTIAADSGGATALYTALHGLSNLGPGDVQVTVGSGATAGKLVVTFTGARAGTNVPQIAATGTGASATTATAGGSAVADGREKAVGILWGSITIPDAADTTVDATCAVLTSFATVKVSKLPANNGLDALSRDDLRLINFED